MKSHRRPRSARAFRHSCAVSILVVAGVFASGSGAFAAPLEADDAPPQDRVIEVDGPMPTAAPPTSLRSTGDVTEWTSEAVPIPDEYYPEPGQTVTIHYNDGVVVHTGVIEDDNAPNKEARAAALAACTFSQSAGVPTIASGGTWRVTSAMSFSLGSGCTDRRYVSGSLDWQWLGIAQRKAKVDAGFTYPGNAVNFNVAWNCNSSSNTNWRAYIDVSGSPQYTSWYSRACGG